MAQEVDAEARYQVRRLRNHPSLALWCGNNENQWIHGMREWQHPEEPTPGDLYLRHDPAASRAATSTTVRPTGRAARTAGTTTTAWKRAIAIIGMCGMASGRAASARNPPATTRPRASAIVNYAWDMGRFISEFGMHAAPVFETLRRNHSGRPTLPPQSPRWTTITRTTRRTRATT